MCFMKSSPDYQVATTQTEDIAQRKEANASLTKNSNQKNQSSIQNQFVKTSPVGLTENPKIEKKTLLGE